MPAKKKSPTIREKAIENSILSFLKLHGIFVFKVESQGTFDSKLGRYRLKKSIHRTLGVADIVGLMPDGRFLCIEVKSAIGRLSEHQKHFLKSVEENGGIALVARSVEDVALALGLSLTRRRAVAV